MPMLTLPLIWESVSISSGLVSLLDNGGYAALKFSGMGAASVVEDTAVGCLVQQGVECSHRKSEVKSSLDFHLAFFICTMQLFTALFQGLEGRGSDFLW